METGGCIYIFTYTHAYIDASNFSIIIREKEAIKLRGMEEDGRKGLKERNKGWKIEGGMTSRMR